MTLRTALGRVGLGLVVPVVVIAVWQVATTASPSFFWPSPLTILQTFPETWFEGRIADDVVPTLVRLLVGYALALVIGIPLGIAIGRHLGLRLFVEPPRDLLRAIPPTVLVPVFIVFAGIGNESKVLVIFWGCFWSILLNTTEGVRGIDEVQLDIARSYRISRMRALLRVVLPSALPKIVVGARQALSIGIIMTVISEMFAASNGIGFNIIQFQRSFSVPEMWTGMVLLGLIGVALNIVFRLVERWVVLPWYYGMQRVEK